MAGRTKRCHGALLRALRRNDLNGALACFASECIAVGLCPMGMGRVVPTVAAVQVRRAGPELISTAYSDPSCANARSVRFVSPEAHTVGSSPGTTRQMLASPFSNGKPVSWLM